MNRLPLTSKSEDMHGQMERSSNTEPGSRSLPGLCVVARVGVEEFHLAALRPAVKRRRTRQAIAD